MTGRKFLEFIGVTAFEEFIKELDIYNNQWKIREGLLNERGRAVQNRVYFRELRFKFDNLNLFHMKVSLAETVSWLDSFTHIQRIITKLKEFHPKTELEKTEILFEYVIEMSKSSRVDVIFKFENRLCLLEFSTVNKFERIKRAFQQKRIELMMYKDLMQNYLPKDSKVIVLPFIGLYEYHKRHRVESHYFNNVKQAEFAAEYISKFLISDYSIQFP